MREVEFIEEFKLDLTRVELNTLYKLSDLAQDTDADIYTIRPSKLYKGEKEVAFETAQDLETYGVYVGCESDDFEPEVVRNTDGQYILIFKKVEE